MLIKEMTTGRERDTNAMVASHAVHSNSDHEKI
jgi:hypothetical protein